MPRKDDNQLWIELRAIRSDVQELRKDINQYKGFWKGAASIIGIFGIAIGYLIKMLPKFGS
jgi:hypothetical protein